MKILVTGGAGFIGSHLCGRLLRDNHEVICLDNLYSGSLGNIKKFLTNPRFTFINHDITKPFRFAVDQIYNLACPASPTSYQIDKVYTLKTNILGALNVLELAKATGARVLQASTSEVYGDPLEHPQRETYFGNVNFTGPRSCYDEGKRAAETLFFDYHREYKVDIRVVRIFNTFGPKMALNDGRVISNFISQALRGEDLTVYDKGRQTRSFMYVDDLIEGLVSVMGNDDFVGPVNLGNPYEITIRKLAEKIIEMTNSTSKIVYLAPLQNDPQRRLPDITLAKEKIGWSPKYGKGNFEFCLANTIEYFAARIGEKVNILVFSTAYRYPSAEFMDAPQMHLKDLIEEIPYFHFHIVTGRWDKNERKFHGGDNFTIHRIGIGNAFDKYLFTLLSPFKAMKLHKQHRFALSYSIRATYALLPSLFFKLFYRVPFMIMIHKHDFSPSTIKKAKIISPIYRLVFRKSSAIHMPDEELVRKIGDVNRNLATDILSIESTVEIRKIKEAFHRIINEADKRLVKPT